MVQRSQALLRKEPIGYRARALETAGGVGVTKSYLLHSFYLKNLTMKFPSIS